MSEVYSSPENALSETVERLLSQRPVAEPLPIREGLPPTFRMRADAHYVELLDSPPRPGVELVAVSAIELRNQKPTTPAPALVESIERHGVLQPLLVQSRNGRYRLLAGHHRLAAAVAAGLREVPCIVNHSDDDAAEVIAAATNVFTDRATGSAGRTQALAADAAHALGESLTSLGACAGLVAEPAPQLTHRVAIDLLRAEAWRAVCLLQVARVLRGEVAIYCKPTSARGLLHRLIESTQHECRLRGGVLDAELPQVDVRIDADEDVIVGVLGGVLTAAFAAADSRAALRLAVTATIAAGRDFVLSITHPSLRLPAGLASADGVEGEGIMAASLAAARQVVAACDGRLEVAAAGRGTEIRVTLPALS